MNENHREEIRRLLEDIEQEESCRLDIIEKIGLEEVREEVLQSNIDRLTGVLENLKKNNSILADLVKCYGSK